MVSDASHALHALPNLALPQKKDIHVLKLVFFADIALITVN